MSTSHNQLSKVLYMCFDKFLLAVESRDLSQADKSIIRVYSFPKLRMSSRTSFSVSQQLRPELFANECSQFSHIYLSPEKLRKVFTFQSSKFLNDKLTKTSILPNFQVPNSFF